jgi:acetylornithine deacetylase
MQPVIAHKGKLSQRIVVRGRPGHSSDPRRGVNAVHCAAETIAWIAAEGRRIAADGPFETGFDPPYTTLHVGSVQGGTALNIIPERATFVMEWRTIPGDDASRGLARLKDHVATAIEPPMRRVDPATGFTYEPIAQLPSLALDVDHPLAALVCDITGAGSAGKVSFGTEGGFYQRAGIASIVCGPGSVAQAHQPDEWIAEEQLAHCDTFMRRLAERLG